MAPLFSIIIPVYNSGNTIERCIESIIYQKFTNWEIILIDDGSTDNSSVICKRYAMNDSRIQYLYKTNGGVSSARNLGLDNATGTWITFIDSDDTIAQDYFSLSNLEEVDLAIQRWRFSKDKDSIEPLDSGVYKDSYCKNFMQSNLHKDIMRCAWAKFLKKTIIEKNNIRFDSNIKLGEDTIFMLEYFQFVKSISVNNTSYYVYYRSENWDGNKFSFDKQALRYFYKKLYYVYKPLPYKSQKLIDFLNDFLYGMVIDVNNQYDRLYIETIPEYLILNKYRMLCPGKVAHIKWYLLRTLSILHNI